MPFNSKLNRVKLPERSAAERAQTVTDTLHLDSALFAENVGAFEFDSFAFGIVVGFVANFTASHFITIQKILESFFLFL